MELRRLVALLQRTEKIFQSDMYVCKQGRREGEREEGEGEESKRSSGEPMTAEGEISENLMYNSASRSASTSW